MRTGPLVSAIKENHARQRNLFHITVEMGIRTSMNRTELAGLIADFCAPLGPEVFAGLGTELQKQRLLWLHDPVEYMEKSEAYVSAWAENVDIEETLAALADLLERPPGYEFYQDFCVRLRNDWEYGISTFFHALAAQDPARTRQVLKTLSADRQAATLAAEILEEIGEKD